MTRSATSSQTPAPPASTTNAPSPRRRQLARGVIGFVLGALGAFFLMSIDRGVPFAPLWGGLAVLVCSLSVLAMCGLLRASPDDLDLRPRLLDPLPGEPALLAPRITLPAAALLLLGGGLAVGVEHIAIPIALALLLLLASGLRRPALFVFAAVSLPILPMLGQYGLWDPWETHYGEVAREILARADWITLWWAQDEWFRSKPVLIFWMEALSWGALGVPFEADANPAHPEWAIRLPHYLLAMGALLASYAAMARIFGRRVAVIASLVLATTPYFFFMSHQAITDMPFVATMTIAVALLAIALEAKDGEEVARYRLGPVSISWHGVLLVAVVMVALPQALYLLSRNVTFILGDSGFWVHRDQFLFGSAGNSGIPGNPDHRMRSPYLNALWFQPFAQGLLWLVGLLLLIRAVRRERSVAGVAMFGFYLFCSLAWMAKGIPGFALPGLIAALYLLASGRLGLLASGRLRVGSGILMLAVTGLPWYVAMYARLGPFFTDRLFIHDHINRLAQGVHGDTGSIQYFLWQLGYGAFPWIGLMPLGFAAWLYLTPGEEPEQLGRRRTALLLALWGAAAFTLFSAMITKFHHYIFPAVPPLSLLVGIVLDRMLWTPGSEAPQRRWIALSACAPLLMVLGVGGWFGDVRGVAPEDVGAGQLSSWVTNHPWNASLCFLLVLLGVVGLGEAARRLEPASSQRDASRLVVLSTGLLGAAVLTGFAGRDLSWVTDGRPWGHERLIQLFIYKYERPFPEHLDYRPILTGFAVVASGMLLLASLTRLKRIATYGLLGTTFWFSAWALNVYMIDLSPHWSQRELVKHYYRDRTGADEPLVAWQMNWKGENLYTGNRVHVFVDLDNKKIRAWLDKNSGKRAYFVLEHTRLANFKRMMGSRSVEELTTARDNNKFLLVRAKI